MGQRRLATPQKDDANKRPQSKKSNNAVLNSTTTRKGEVFRAQRRTSENVNLRASQHLIDIPVNKSVYNGYGGEQFSAKRTIARNRPGLSKTITKSDTIDIYANDVR
jgi:ribonuclease J